MSKSVGSADLRKMMQQVRATKVGSVTAKFKKYKLSSREQQLIEEQKARERLAAEAEEQEWRRRRRAAPSAGTQSTSAAPVKSILKKTNYVPPVLPTTSSLPQATSTDNALASSRKSIPPVSEEASVVRSERRGNASQASKSDEDAKEESEPTGDLPEGFFDDPQQDAKARKIEYKDPAEEEWEKFQKEISQELTVARDIATEDQEEATVDRQLDEIDDQMRAWSRVSKLEKKLDAVGARVSKLKERAAPADEDDSDDDEDEIDTEFDWRKKC